MKVKSEDGIKKLNMSESEKWRLDKVTGQSGKNKTIGKTTIWQKQDNR